MTDPAGRVVEPGWLDAGLATTTDPVEGRTWAALG